jgi:hypothetical protein
MPKDARLSEGMARIAEEITLKAQSKAGECLTKLENRGKEGPGIRIDENATLLEQVRHRRVPIIGRGGTGVWSFVHIDMQPAQHC